MASIYLKHNAQHHRLAPLDLSSEASAQCLSPVRWMLLLAVLCLGLLAVALEQWQRLFLPV